MPTDEFQLIRKIKHGDNDSMEILFKQHVEAAVRLAYLITKNWSTAEDAVQEAFIQAFHSIHTFKEGMPFKPWFTRIVINKSKRVKSKFEKDTPGLDSTNLEQSQGLSPEDLVLAKERKDLLFFAINELDEKHRLPLILKYLSELSEAETAAVLDIPVSTVKSRLYVARQRLKRGLESQKGREDSEE